MVIKRDFILAATMLVIGIIAYLCMKFLPENGSEVKVYVDGKETAHIVLRMTEFIPSMVRMEIILL